MHRQRIEQVQRHHRARVADRGEVVGLVPAVEQGEVGQQRRRQRCVEAERGQAGIELGAQGGIGGVVHPCIVGAHRSEEHTSELQVTNAHLVCRLLLEKKKNRQDKHNKNNEQNIQTTETHQQQNIKTASY